MCIEVKIGAIKEAMNQFISSGREKVMVIIVLTRR
jgi:hypothetical protein